MTSTELKHQAQLQKWSAAVRDCRSSELPVRQWCREHGITPTTYYRWERELLKISGESSSLAETAPIAFAELPAPKQECRNGSECSATLRIGSACIEFHQELNAELLKAMVEVLLSC